MTLYKAYLLTAMEVGVVSQRRCGLTTNWRSVVSICGCGVLANSGGVWSDSQQWRAVVSIGGCGLTANSEGVRSA